MIRKEARVARPAVTPKLPGMKPQGNPFVKVEEFSKTFIETIRDFFTPNTQNMNFPKYNSEIFKQLDQTDYSWTRACH